MKFLLLFFLILFKASLCYGFSPGGAISTGIIYDSNIRYLYIPDMFAAGIDLPEKEGFFIMSEGEIGFYRKNLSIAYSLYSRGGISRPETSELDNYLSVSFTGELSEKLRFDLLGMTHYSLRDYTEKFHHLFLDNSLSTSFYYDHSNHMALYAGASFSAVSALNENVKNFSGPVPGLQSGVYFHPKKDANYIFLNSKLSFYFLRDWKISYRFDDVVIKTLEIPGNFHEISAGVETYWNFKDLSLLFTIDYEHRYFYEPSLLRNYEKSVTVKTQRTDNALKVHISLIYPFFKDFSLIARYAFTAQKSTVGSHPEHYTDHSYTQHVISTGIKWEF